MAIINTNLLPILGTGGNPADGTYVDEVYKEFQNYGSGSDRTVDITPFSFENDGFCFLMFWDLLGMCLICFWIWFGKHIFCVEKT